ncbi:MAG: WD40/YVTN/BNR-like repeat-containing protein [Cyclobacteriaceae bacterium]
MKRLITLIYVFMLFLSPVTGQQLNMEKLKGIKPRSIGPAGMSGRITAIEAVVSNRNIIYAGAASGGLWKTANAGITWEPIFDKETVLSIGAVAIQQSNPSVVWVGTGEGNPRNSLNSGGGVYKSLDGGKSWNRVGLEKTRNIHRILIDPMNPNTVYVGAIGSPWFDHPERGVFKTTDGGQTWDRVLYVNERTGTGEMVMDPVNPNKIFVSMWEHRRQPWTFKSGGSSSGLYVTFDGGKNWKKLSSKEGLPEGDLGRMGLAIAKSKPDVVYALIESKKNALYRSMDGGFKWEMINDKAGEIGDRPFYYYEIYADPKNENRIYSIFSGVNISEDGGKSFRPLLSSWAGVHPDHHAWWIDPNDPAFLVDGNDGGLNISQDMGKSWRFSENIPVGQFYHINVDMNHPYNVYGGMQDNGTWVGPAYVWRNDGIRNSYWQEVYFGDGFDAAPDPDNSRYGYAMSQGGNIGRYDIQTGFVKNIKPTHPDAEMKLRFNWNAAFAQDPFNSSVIYYGSQFLHRSNNKGSTWDVISEDLTTNDPSKQRQYESGGLTMDATGAENHCTLLTIAPSPKKQGVIWTGSDDGQIHVTEDGGKTWKNVTSRITGMPKNAWVPQIQASVHNAGEAFAVVNNYRQGDYKPYFFRTRDYGNTWESLVTAAEIGESNYMLASVQDPEEPKLIFLGTENGLFVSINEGKNWTRWTNNYPAGVPTMDLVIHPREHDLVIGTFGRAFYVMDDIRPLRALAKSGDGILNKTIHLFNPPDAYAATIQQPEGSRFDADAIYNGENRPTGAMISYVVNKPVAGADEKKPETNKPSGKSNAKSVIPASVPQPEKPKAPAPKSDSVKLEVFDAGNKLIRTINQKAPEDNGVNRMYWNLTEKGVRPPSRPGASGGRRGFFGEPSGPVVNPGVYKLRITYAGQKDSTTIKVFSDPRLNVDSKVFADRYALQKQIMKLTEDMGAAGKRLNESSTIVDEFDKKIREAKRSDLKDAGQQTKAMRDSLNVLMDLVYGKEDKRQGITMSETRNVMDYVFTASGYIGRAMDPVNDTDNRVIKHAQGKVSTVLKRVDSFFNGPWKQYREMMEKNSISPFRDYPPLIKN